MTSLIGLIAKQAKVTFSKCVTDASFQDSLDKLVRFVNKLKASDVNLEDSLLYSMSRNVMRPPPVLNIHVFEHEVFMIGIFVLKSGGRIPLHDHPGMHGVLKTIKGTIRITSYTEVTNVPGDGKLPKDICHRVKGKDRESLIPVEKISSAYLSETDEPCVLRPKEGNYHEISSVGGTAAFIDILSPPYDMIERECNYYICLGTNDTDSEVKFWLLEKPPTLEFWAEEIPYSGPEIEL